MSKRCGKKDLVVPATEEHHEPQRLQFRDGDDGEIKQVSSHQDAIAAVRRMFGVEETGTLGTRLLGQVAGVMDPLNGKAMSVSEANDSAALLEGIAPKDAVEGMLAIQMITAHSAAMRFLRIASRSGQSPQVVEVNTNQAIKLMRTYTAQVEALNKYRSKGRQTMTVEHVHVHEGGQAIVGNVARGGGEGAQP